ncbi:hypothetical protein FVEN_g11717 [Fusarium venenatum]|uniref:Uncharacterized protein n=1 Tax=Fusarium venenatum TaxID=56646 RepID=A0A2L2T3S0_9HYPO|nr:uncharacterized protein FVRRES_11159 [Fusarium venenatum]KAG8350106.1 hypothetical protein FVEN_g11717 [Fusarium venenatum]KAH6977883.1 hypothetical protein EDB82DRAFT_525977 [Fusarium venenatum]CEI38468.1 unnamed protein product [Fusarium venenatum]
MKLCLALALVSLLGVVGAGGSGARLVTVIWSTGERSLTYQDTEGTSHPIGGKLDGCQTTIFDWIDEICLSETKRNAHLSYTDGGERCFGQSSRSNVTCGTNVTCDITFFTETECNWKWAAGFDSSDTKTRTVEIEGR